MRFGPTGLKEDVVGLMSTRHFLLFAGVLSVLAAFLYEEHPLDRLDQFSMEDFRRLLVARGLLVSGVFFLVLSIFI